LLTVVCVGISASFLTLSAQEGVVIHGEKHSDPKLIFQGDNSSNASLVARNFRNCGWFEMVPAGSRHDYAVSMVSSGDSIQLTLKNSAGVRIADFYGRSTDPERRAAEAVDAVLKNLFNIPGICRTAIVFSAETGVGKREIYMCDFNGRNIKPVTTNNTLSVEPAWTPDGNSIIYCFYGNSYTTLVQYRFDIKKSRRLTSYKGMNAGGAMSPDGKYLALILSRDGMVDLYVRPTEGGSLTRLTRNKAVEASPAWTPDGKYICFVSDDNGRPRLYMIPPNGGQAKYLSTGLRGSERVTPDFSDSGLLAYSAKVGGSHLLTVAEGSGKSWNDSATITIGGKAIPCEGPSWAPDNRHVVIADRGILYIVDTWHGKRRQLLGGSSKTFQPDWSPILK
ncbi:MAG: PD40 domain-containing protein, partial [Lentisphaeria bacterium]|nr:PD40 domain-containing protein [Lentisphaeria bacterium]